MPFVNVGSLAALPPGQVMEAEIGGNTYVVCNSGGDLYAYDGLCPHAGGPLGQGAMDGNTLVCPWHAWEYDCRTGINDYDEGVRLTPFPVKSQDGLIFIDVP